MVADNILVIVVNGVDFSKRLTEVPKSFGVCKSPAGVVRCFVTNITIQS